MTIINGLAETDESAVGSVLAIGNFDGVHRGHAQLVAKACAIAAKLGRPAGVLTFEPHPRHIFRPDDPPFRITPFPLKARRLEACGADLLFSLTFDWDFASQSAEAFIDNVLRRALQPAHIVVGYDFGFGQMRQGNADTLRTAGYDVTVLEKIADEGGATYSSSAIRTALRQGDLTRANALLGWEWEIEGIVFKGDQRGRELGYPTANVRLEDTIHPAYGVYATLVQIEGETQWRAAATNIGIRPMFEVPVGQVEAHILDFEGDLYGKTLRIRPVSKLRGEARFGSLEALIAQIEQDCAQTKTLLDSANISFS